MPSPKVIDKKISQKDKGIGCGQDGLGYQVLGTFFKKEYLSELKVSSQELETQLCLEGELLIWSLICIQSPGLSSKFFDIIELSSVQSHFQGERILLFLFPAFYYIFFQTYNKQKHFRVNTRILATWIIPLIFFF